MALDDRTGTVDAAAAAVDEWSAFPLPMRRRPAPLPLPVPLVVIAFSALPLSTRRRPLPARMLLLSELPLSTRRMPPDRTERTRDDEADADDVEENGKPARGLLEPRLSSVDVLLGDAWPEPGSETKPALTLSGGIRPAAPPMPKRVK
jgi:hypothetical protein